MARGSRPKETILSYRAAYGRTQEGRWAFARLLESGGFLKRIDNEEQRATHNMMVTLIENMGMTQGVNASELYDRLAVLLLNLTIPDEAIEGKM